MHVLNIHEHYLRIYSELYNIHTVSLRFANVYGKYSMNKGSVVTTYKNILNKDVIKINGAVINQRFYLR